MILLAILAIDTNWGAEIFRWVIWAYPSEIQTYRRAAALFRNAKPINPVSPVPSRSALLGSGVVEGEEPPGSVRSTLSN